MPGANTMTIKDPNFLADMRGSNMDPGHLETLGKRAAALSESGELSLTDAVVQTIGKTKLNAEQVKRVVEFANQTAFDRKYASLDASMRVVHINGGPADPVQVLQDLNDGARPEHTVMQNLDYVLPPSGSKTSSLDFGLGQVSEEDSGLRGRTIAQIQQLRSKLSAAHEELTLLEGSNRLQMTEALRQLQQDVHTAVKTAGLCREDLMAAWAGVDSELISTALGAMGLLPQRPPGTKVAQRVNPAHPVVSGYKSFVRFAKKYAQATMARKDVEMQLVKVDEFVLGHTV